MIPSYNRPIRPTGFTLLELLVVATVIAVLISCLLPAIDQARRIAHRMVCLSNQKQIALAMAFYCQDHRDQFPVAYSIDYGAMTLHEWDYSTRGREVRPGMIWRYVDGTKVQQCPSYRGRSNTAVENPYTGYNYNASYIGRGAFEGSWGGMSTAPATQAEVRNHQSTALIGDGGYLNGANKYMRSPYDAGPLGELGAHAGGQAFRHVRSTTNVAWVDGHASTHDKSPARKAGASAEAMSWQNWPENGFLGADEGLYDLK